ncbi:hypothetical protein MKX01_018421 [Papaver californicum]|nr:hypothetical protein MKX01_018421 [Papaver californicum]
MDIQDSWTESPRSGGIGTPRSPEAKLGLRVEDLWDIQQPQLSPSEKLNSLIEINSDSSLADAVSNIVQAQTVDLKSEVTALKMRPTSTAGANGAVENGCSAPEAAASMGGSFFETLTSPNFIRLQSLPVVDLGEGNIDNIITQSSVVHMLAECVGLHWFESWGTKKLKDLGLPIMKPQKLIKVYEEEPVLKAFKLMREKRIGGLAVVEDVQFLRAAPEIYKDYRSISAKNFLTAVRNHLKEQQEVYQYVILKLDSEKINRIYVVDEDENLEGVISLRDIISKLVHEPRGYFGDFFDGVVPLPRNSSSV